MFDPFNTLKYAELRHKERLEEAERALRYENLPAQPSQIRAKLAAFVQRLSAPVAEQPCPEVPCEHPQPAH